MDTLISDHLGNLDWMLELSSNCDETSLAVSLGSRTVAFHDAGTLKRLSSICGAHSGRINCIESSRNNPNLVMTCADDKLVKYWDARSSGASGAVLQFRFTEEVLSASMGTQDLLLAAATGNCLKFVDSRKSQEASSSKSSDEDEAYQTLGRVW